jgi:hypothetical protein
MLINMVQNDASDEVRLRLANWFHFSMRTARQMVREVEISLDRSWWGVP